MGALWHALRSCSRVTKPLNEYSNLKLSIFDRSMFRSIEYLMVQKGSIFDYKVWYLMVRLIECLMIQKGSKFDKVRYSIDRSIEYLNYSKRFDIRGGSMVQYSMVRSIEYLKNSKRFDIRGGSMVWYSIDRISQGFEKTLFTVYVNPSHIQRLTCNKSLIQFERGF